MKDKNFFNDSRSIAYGILSTFSGIKSEIENLINIKIEKYLNKKGYVTREDFHALEDRVNKLSLEIKVSKAKKNKLNMDFNMNHIVLIGHGKMGQPLQKVG